MAVRELGHFDNDTLIQTGTLVRNQFKARRPSENLCALQLNTLYSHLFQDRHGLTKLKPTSMEELKYNRESRQPNEQQRKQTICRLN